MSTRLSRASWARAERPSSRHLISPSVGVRVFVTRSGTNWSYWINQKAGWLPTLMVGLRVSSREINKCVLQSIRPPRSSRTAPRTDIKRCVVPSTLDPGQLCQLVETAPSGPRWLHEIKLDGFRMSARIDRGRVQLLTRTGLDWSEKCPSVVEALAKVGAKTAYLDGELCGMGDDGCQAFPGPRPRATAHARFALSISFSISYIATAATSRACRSSNARRFLSRWSRKSLAFSSTATRRATGADQKACRPTWA